MSWILPVGELMLHGLAYFIFYIGPYKFRIQYGNVEPLLRSMDVRAAEKPTHALAEEVRTDRELGLVTALFFLGAAFAVVSPLSPFASDDGRVAPEVPLLHVALLCTVAWGLFMIIVRQPYHLISLALICELVAEQLPDGKVTREDVKTLSRSAKWSYLILVVFCCGVSICAVYSHWGAEPELGDWPFAILLAILLLAWLANMGFRHDLRRYTERVTPQIDEALRSGAWRPGELPEILTKKPHEEPKAEQAAAQ